MATTKQIIDSSLRLIGVLASGEQAQPKEWYDALNTLNDIIATYNTQNLLIPYLTTDEFEIEPNKTIYTIGIGDDFDFNTQLPSSINTIFIYNADLQLKAINPFKILNPKDSACTFNFIVNETKTSCFIYREDKQEIEFYNLPADVDKIKVVSLKPITEIDEITEETTLPSKYNRLLKYALACDLSIEYGVTDPLLRQLYMERRQEERRLKVNNATSRPLEADLGLGC